MTIRQIMIGLSVASGVIGAAVVVHAQCSIGCKDLTAHSPITSDEQGYDCIKYSEYTCWSTVNTEHLAAPGADTSRTCYSYIPEQLIARSGCEGCEEVCADFAPNRREMTPPAECVYISNSIRRHCVSSGSL